MGNGVQRRRRHLLPVVVLLLTLAAVADRSLAALFGAPPPAGPPSAADDDNTATRCSRTCESEYCVGTYAQAPLMRYGKYCGVSYTGCPGEHPCDALDACCNRPPPAQPPASCACMRFIA
ncbi:hypothetical protein GUJ93_ZPchr0013g35621 [Zizania palustris]|uniref:Uncharacterized protein n=1 Tax=Zizania palustris TaxID=103762 RepID=A0A8J6C263_ZIZPA|nr:hypothetical protein GUJ93_ZPchr0013g35621 [Zizania palustris]